MRVETRKKHISTAHLRGDERKQLWAGIQKTKPKLAELMQNDPIVQELKNKFNASFLIEENEFYNLIESGQQLQGCNNDNNKQ